MPGGISSIYIGLFNMMMLKYVAFISGWVKWVFITLGAYFVSIGVVDLGYMIACALFGWDYESILLEVVNCLSIYFTGSPITMSEVEFISDYVAARASDSDIDSLTLSSGDHNAPVPVNDVTLEEYRGLSWYGRMVTVVLSGALTVCTTCMVIVISNS